MAVDLERVRLREEKNGECRCGISLVWFPGQPLMDAADACIEAVERACPVFLTPYPVLHASIFRCGSLKEPIGPIRGFGLLAAGAEELCGGGMMAQKMLLCGDGVLRLQFSPLDIGQSASLRQFYQMNGLTFEQVTEPWISFGLVNRVGYPDARAVERVWAAVENTDFPQIQCDVGHLRAVAYEDILLRSHRVLATLCLGGTTQ